MSEDNVEPSSISEYPPPAGRMFPAVSNWAPATFWERITLPHFTIQVPVRRRRARLLSSLLVVLVLASVLAILLTLIVHSSSTEFLIGWVDVVVLALAYALSRTRYHLAAAALMIGVATISVLAGSILSHNSDYLYFLILCVLMTSLFLSPRATALVAILTVGAILLLALGTATFSLIAIINQVYLVGLIGILATVASHVQRQDLKQIEQQARDLAAEIIERKQTEEALRYSNSHDILTGLYNRFYFEEALVRISSGHHFPVGVVIADIDDLKTVNDTQGHAAGDELLQVAAGALKIAFRAQDIVARIGGDEFAILLPNMDASTTEEILTRIRRALNTQPLAAPWHTITISVGMAIARTGEELGEALKVADAQMYQEKLMHRSRIN